MNNIIIYSSLGRTASMTTKEHVGTERTSGDTQPVQEGPVQAPCPSSELMVMIRRWLPASMADTQRLIDLKHNGTLPPLDMDALSVSFAHEAFERSRQLEDLHDRMRRGDVPPPDPRALADVLANVDEQDMGPQLHELEALARHRLEEDDEGYASDGADDSRAQASSSDFLARIFQLMKDLDTQWLSRFSDILQNYVSFFNKLTDAMALLSGAIKGTEKDGKLTVDFSDLRKALEKLCEEVRNGPGLGGNFKDKAEAEAFLKELGLEDLMVRENADKSIELVINPDRITAIIEQFPPKKTSITPSTYTEIIGAKDNMMERFNHINRVLPEKYQRQLQMFDTLMKTLSGTSESMADTTKLILQNMAS